MNKEIQLMCNKTHVSNDTYLSEQILDTDEIFLSDKQLKTNIKSLQKSIETIDFYEYYMKNDPVKRKKYGVIAQEIQRQYPELVSKTNSGIMAVDYNSLFSLVLSDVTHKIPNMQEKIDKLDANILKQNEQINALKRLVWYQASLLNKLSESK